TEEPYIPTEEDITNIVRKLEGSKYEVPIKLACLGLRQSEIGGLSIEDIKDGKAFIHRSKTQGEDNAWVLEDSNKTAASTRTVELPPTLYEKILEQGYIYNGSLHTLYDVLKRTCKALEIPQISIHKLRHFYASYCHEKGFSEAQIMEMGGWSTPNVMKAVYRHAMNKEKAKKDIANSIGNLF
ncbi:MAG: site-specific integrase, partial [Bacteroidales bacterium]|nr:site-specific integrase [Candidatus Scybalousia scybalohippi]